MLEYTLLFILTSLLIINDDINANDFKTSSRFEKIFKIKNRNHPFSWTPGIVTSSLQENLNEICEYDVHPFPLISSNVQVAKIVNEFLNLQPESNENIQVEMIKCVFPLPDKVYFATASLLAGNEKLTPVIKTYDGFILRKPDRIIYADLFTQVFSKESNMNVQWTDKKKESGFLVMCLQQGHTRMVEFGFEKFTLNYNSNPVTVEMLVLHCQNKSTGSTWKNFYYVGLNGNNGNTSLLAVDHNKNKTWYFQDENTLGSTFRKNKATMDNINIVKQLAIDQSNKLATSIEDRRYNWSIGSKTLLEGHLIFICYRKMEIHFEDINSVKIITGYMKLMPHGENRYSEILECWYTKEVKEHLVYLVPVTIHDAQYQDYRELSKLGNDEFVFLDDLEHENLHHEWNSKFLSLYVNGKTGNEVITWTNKIPPKVVLNRFCQTLLIYNKNKFGHAQVYEHRETQIVDLLLSVEESKLMKISTEMLVCVEQKDGEDVDVFTGVINPYIPTFMAPVANNYFGYYEFDSVAEFTKKLLTERLLFVMKSKHYLSAAGILNWITYKFFHENLMRRCSQHRPQGIMKKITITLGNVWIYLYSHETFEMEIVSCQFHQPELNFKAIVTKPNPSELMEVQLGPDNKYLMVIPGVSVQEMHMYANSDM